MNGVRKPEIDRMSINTRWNHLWTLIFIYEEFGLSDIMVQNWIKWYFRSDRLKEIMEKRMARQAGNVGSLESQNQDGLWLSLKGFGKVNLNVRKSGR